jgi:hypothetical protein
MEFLKEIGKLDEFLEDHPEVKEENWIYGYCRFVKKFR